MGVSETNLPSRASGGIGPSPAVAKLLDRTGRAVKYVGYLYALYSAYEVITNDSLSVGQRAILLAHNLGSKVDPTGIAGYIPVRRIIDTVNANDARKLEELKTEIRDQIGKVEEIITEFRDP